MLRAEIDRFDERTGAHKMNDWLRQTAECLRKQRDEKASDDAVFLETQRLTREFGPELWNQVASEIKTNCDGLNREIGDNVARVNDTPNGGLSVQAKTPKGLKELHATFDANKCLLRWRAESKEGKYSCSTGQYEVSVGKDNRAALYSMNEKGESLFTSPSSAKGIAEEMLTALFS